ncbi:MULTISPECIES: hypothetical protein [unclassified Polaromonas]|jgi:hypothetical protein|uniref:hypothetical protein n=1 Tax=unclassified Polaromonas TaxID=2638319 RepID=UPI0025FB38E6|nr:MULTISPECIES: hypothetical protein [unclassified Polaromonas]HQR97048.1 hypothetical protein [Polaromonas sp.]HQS39048.1 hypothetical protein [Polaromonas sp.]HQS89386.1 hypothetical protein [Polaromonas sp.]
MNLKKRLATVRTCAPERQPWTRRNAMSTHCLQQVPFEALGSPKVFQRHGDTFDSPDRIAPSEGNTK